MADDKKIIIDEDWKAQVQAEKDAAAKDSGDPAPADTGSVPEDVPLPPPTLELLATMLATESMISMGVVPHPATGQVQVHRNQARHLIDMIEMLRDKTKGNATETETQLFDALLHQLRMAFVQTGQEFPETPPIDHLA